MSIEKRIDRYLGESLDALEDDRFQIDEHVPFEDSHFDAVATKVQQKGIGSQELVFVFARFAKLNYNRMHDFVAVAYDYAKATRRASMPIGMANLLWVYAVALAERASNDLIDSTCGDNPAIQGFGYIAFPVVYDAGNDEVYYYEGRGGGFGSRGVGQAAGVVQKYLIPE